MNKQELKSIIKDMRYFYIKEGTTGQDGEMLHIITEDNQFYTICTYDELPPKVGINTITVAIYSNDSTRNLYLKNGLKSFRDARKVNLI